LKDLYTVMGADCRWFSIGKRSGKGHPHHPLYLSKGLGLDEFDVKAYIDGVN
jgi:hypothetical protein